MSMEFIDLMMKINVCIMQDMSTYVICVYVCVYIYIKKLNGYHFEYGLVHYRSIFLGTILYYTCSLLNIHHQYNNGLVMSIDFRTD
jgi:hypothetical protein